MNIRHHRFLLIFVALLTITAAARPDQKTLYEKQSPYNTIVVTEDDQGMRTLYFERGGVRQSVVKVDDPDHIELPYARSMLAGLAVVDRRQRMLIVGLGGGTIPCFLHKHFPTATIDVVDIDPDVVAVAKGFFGVREDARLHTHVGDGRQFIEQCQTPYDIIFLDAFGADNIPYHLATREFLVAVRRALTPDGAAVGNVWSRRSNRLYDDMVRTYQDVFRELYVLDVPGAGNKILMALPRPRRLGRADLSRRASAVGNAGQFPFDIGQLVAFGYHRLEATARRGRVLTDDRQPGRAR